MSSDSFEELIQLLKEYGFEQYAIAWLLIEKYGFGRYVIARLRIAISANRSAQEAETYKASNVSREDHLATALKAYQQSGDVQQCISILSTKYAEHWPPLLPEEMSSKSLEKLIQRLKESSFRQYAIARLIIAILKKHFPQEAEACKALNPSPGEYLEKVLAAYRQENVQECIKLLSTKYDSDQPIPLEEEMYNGSFQRLTTLAKYGFGPDVRAWLLLMKTSQDYWEVQMISKYVLLLEKALKDLAQDLDKRVAESMIVRYMRVLDEWINFLNKLWEKWWHSKTNELDKFSWSILAIQQKLWQLGYHHVVLDSMEELKNARDRVQQDMIGLKTPLQIAKMREIRDQMAPLAEGAKCKGNEELANQLVAKASEALKHYLVLNARAKQVSAASSSHDQ